MLVNILGKKVDSHLAIQKAEEADSNLTDLVMDKWFEEGVNGNQPRWQSFFDSFQVTHVNKYGKSFEIKE